MVIIAKILCLILCLSLFVYIIITIYTISYSSKSDFSIEHYPITKRYYPKYNDYYYLKVNELTGIIEKKDAYFFSHADYGETEEEAKELIEKFKEQQLKVNVKKINF